MKAILTYFEVQGRAELARLMLEDLGVDYENDFVVPTAFGGESRNLYPIRQS